MTWWMILGAILALALGIWIGIGAPGWPHKPEGTSRRRYQKRPINPIAWTRTKSRPRR